jgi:hypothetical protein
MSVFKLNSIKASCIPANVSGLKAVYLFLPSEVSNYETNPLYPAVRNLTLKSNAQFCNVEFDLMRGAFFEKTENDTKAGDYTSSTVTIQISRSRLECDTLIARLRNRKSHVLIADYEGVWRLVKNLRLTSDLKIEKGTNAYTFTLSGKSVMPSATIDGLISTNVNVPTLEDFVWKDKSGQKWRLYVTTRGEVVAKKIDTGDAHYSYEVPALDSDYT